MARPEEEDSSSANRKATDAATENADEEGRSGEAGT